MRLLSVDVVPTAEDWEITCQQRDDANEEDDPDDDIHNPLELWRDGNHRPESHQKMAKITRSIKSVTSSD